MDSQIIGIIRPLAQSDIGICVRICQEHFKLEGYSYDVQTELEFSLGKNIYIHEYYVFEEDGIVKGLGGIMEAGFDSGAYGICSCYIDKNFLGKGIGKKLVQFRLNRIKELGGGIVFATTKKQWHLERFGFRPVPTKYNDVWTLMMIDEF